ncbi:MAG: hypothetical protein HUU50_08110 [Candidatus Brocadiae bacterium]|nr:hypothetical protein [Candidatus Brocadiia bacterium]
MKKNKKEIVCNHCLQKQSAMATICKNCGNPLGIIADTYSKHWLSNKALSSSSGIVVIGIWLMFGPFLGGLSWIMWVIIQENKNVFSSLMMIGIPWILCFLLLYITTKNYIMMKYFSGRSAGKSLGKK